jgi:anti-sigma-K factor RskA
MSELNHEHERWREELPAYVLGALDEREIEECERHVRDCQPCQAELRWLRPAVDRLPHGLPYLEPPPQLRERLLSEAREDARVAGSTTAPRVARGRRLGGLSLRPLAGFAAILLLCAAIAGYVIGNGGSGEEASTTVAGHAPGVVASVVRQGETATLKLTNVHELPKRRVLEAWVRRDGDIEPVRALFVPDREGRAETTIANMQGVETVMVTAEPAGGSASPTSAPIVTVPIE